MNVLHPRVWACLVLSWLMTLGLQAQAPVKVALVMGAWEYEDALFSRLPGVDHDVENMAAKLRELGFRVTVVNNPSLRQAKQAVDDFGVVLAQTKGVGLFYFSGHGVEHEGQNYLIPVGTQIGGKADLVQEAMSMDRVLNRMEESQAQVNLVFLDCCRSGMSKSAGDNFSAMNAKGTFIGYATAAKKVAAATDDGSPYTRFLIKHMPTPGLSITDMHTLVTKDVQTFTRQAGSEQTPFQYSGLDSLFYFVPGAGAAPASSVADTSTPGSSIPVPATKPPEVNRDQLIKKDLEQFWDSRWRNEFSNNPEDWASDFASSPHYCYADYNPTTRDFIRIDRGKLTTRWPIRRAKLLGPVRANWTADGQEATITYEFSYEYSNGQGRQTQGKASVTMGLRKLGGEWKITEWTEEVLRNYVASRTPREEERPVSPPSMDERPASGGGSTASLRAFVDNWWAHNHSNSASDWASDFADRVDYCYYEGGGAAGRSFITNDRLKLLQRWTDREYTLVSDPSTSISNDGSSAQVVIKYRYSFAGGGRYARGLSTTTLGLKWSGSRWLITRFHETVRRE